MASFGKLTDYFNRRKSREELRVGRSSRRSGSYCCTVAEARSLERKLQRPLLAKSRTLPSIPQSPTVSRVHHSDLIGGSPPRRKNPSTATSHPKACTLPPAGELWRLEDDMEGEDEPEHGGCTEVRPRSQSPFSHFRARAAYLRKSVSADDHLDMGLDYSPGTAVEGKPSRGKGKLKRKFHSSAEHRFDNQGRELVAQQAKTPKGIFLQLYSSSTVSTRSNVTRKADDEFDDYLSLKLNREQPQVAIRTSSSDGDLDAVREALFLTYNQEASVRADFPGHDRSILIKASCEV
eukprot:superscaffoldBa00000897_g7885